MKKYLLLLLLLIPITIVNADVAVPPEEKIFGPVGFMIVISIIIAITIFILLKTINRKKSVKNEK